MRKRIIFIILILIQMLYSFAGEMVDFTPKTMCGYIYDILIKSDNSHLHYLEGFNTNEVSGKFNFSNLDSLADSFYKNTLLICDPINSFYKFSPAQLAYYLTFKDSLNRNEKEFIKYPVSDSAVYSDTLRSKSYLTILNNRYLHLLQNNEVLDSCKYTDTITTGNGVEYYLSSKQICADFLVVKGAVPYNSLNLRPNIASEKDSIYLVVDSVIKVL